MGVANMRKISFIAILVILISTAAFAADVETGQVATLYEKNYGRSVTGGTSELVTIWYTGNNRNSGFGISDDTIVLYESGIPITATRFDSAANVSLITHGDAESVVNAINSDTSGYFKAAIGRDATPNTTMAFVDTLRDLRLNIGRTEEKAIDNGDVIKEDANASLTLRAGFSADEQTTLRLKSIDSNIKGTGTHTIKVWDGSECVWRKTYGDVTAYNSATPLTANFTSQAGEKGLSCHKGNSLVVSAEWSSDVDDSGETNCNLSIIGGHWKE